MDSPFVDLGCQEMAEVLGRFTPGTLEDNVLAIVAARRHAKHPEHEPGCPFSDPNHWVARAVTESQPQ